MNNIRSLISIMARQPKPLLAVLFFFGLSIFLLFSFIVASILKKEALHNAAREGDINRIETVLREHPEMLEQTNRSGFTPLLTAVFYDRVAALEVLIAHGANVNATWDLVRSNDGGWNALHIAANGGCINVGHVLIRAGTQINHLSSRGETPLDLAVEKGHSKVARLLRTNGAVRGKLSGKPLTPSAIPEYDIKPNQLAEVEIAQGVSMKFCWIPAGTAQLGSPEDERQMALLVPWNDPDRAKNRIASEAEELRGRFTTKGFWLAKFPVTQADWTAVMGKTELHSCYVPDHPLVKDAGITDTSRFPMEMMSWENCQDFLKKLNNMNVQIPASMGHGKFVLPHEDQWEYACRGGLGNSRPFYFGYQLNGKLANCAGEKPFPSDLEKGPSLMRTTEVGSYEKVAPHPWGLCDMTGNVWQWCEKDHKPDDNRRVRRGGSCSCSAEVCRSATRSDVESVYHGPDDGFRLAFVR